MIDKFSIVLRVLIGGGLIVLLFFISLQGEKKFYVDFDEDGANEEIVLENGSVKIFQNAGKLYESDPAWDVKEIIIDDLTNDGNLNIGLYLWKEGNYGSARPFWVSENDKSYKLHLFLYEWKDGSLRSLWNSSNLPYNNVETMVRSVDSENELVILERPYSWGKGPVGESIAVWKWDEWGFTMMERSEKGRYLLPGGI